MPISGLVKSSSRRPAARSMARAGARCGPSVRTLLRGFNELSDTSESLPRNFPGHQKLSQPSPACKNPQELALICKIGPLDTIATMQRAARLSPTEVPRMSDPAESVKLIEMLNNISVTYGSFCTSHSQQQVLDASSALDRSRRGTMFVQFRGKGISIGKRSIHNPMATQASKLSPAPSHNNSYQQYVNPQWVALLNILDMNVRYARCAGSELFTEDGRRILDFLSGYCVHNTGHNHPYIVQALKDELDKSGPAMLQSHVPEIAGELTKRLCQLAGGGLEKVYFGSSGSEGVETAIKFARAATGRDGIVYAKSSFHGLTAGALSLMNDAFWREGFGPLLQDTVGVDYGDVIALEGALQSKRHAALVLEPVQAEAGIRVPSKQYLQKAQELCLKTGTLFVIDEVQTGMFRTGTFLASHQFELRPDIVILAKALSGGLMPVSAVLMTDKIYHAVYSSLRRAIV